MKRTSGWIRLVVTVAHLLTFTIVSAAPAMAQAGGAANVGGEVTDDSGAALPGVTITVTNTATGRAQTLVTGPEGRYRAVALVPGPYEIMAELQGFGAVRRATTLLVGSEAEVNVTLGVAAVAETVTVVGEVPLVEVAKSQPSSVITGDQRGSSNIRLASFNVPTGALDARQIQWGARYSF